ncbi:MAG: NYN domain-containing protein [Verrucomicrobiota bacterium]
MSDVKYLLVDGHSVLFSWNDLRVLHQRKPRSARDQLIKIIQVLHDTGRWRVTLVFDGKTRGNEVTPTNSMIVAYASEDETADSLIERTVGAFPHPDRIWVVTNDRAEAQTVVSLGAHTESTEWLKFEIDACDELLQNTLKNLNKNVSSNRIPLS